MSLIIKFNKTCVIMFKDSPEVMSFEGGRAPWAELSEDGVKGRKGVVVKR